MNSRMETYDRRAVPFGGLTLRICGGGIASDRKPVRAQFMSARAGHPDSAGGGSGGA